LTNVNLKITFTYIDKNKFGKGNRKIIRTEFKLKVTSLTSIEE